MYFATCDKDAGIYTHTSGDSEVQDDKGSDEGKDRKTYLTFLLLFLLKNEIRDPNGAKNTSRKAKCFSDLLIFKNGIERREIIQIESMI